MVNRNQTRSSFLEEGRDRDLDEVYSQPPTKRQKGGDNGVDHSEIRTSVCRDIWKQETMFLNSARHEARRFFTKYHGFIFYGSSSCKWEFQLPTNYLGRNEEIELTNTYLGVDVEEIMRIDQGNTAK